MNKFLLSISLLLSLLFLNVKGQTGIDCSTAVTATIGSTAGNGKSSQYFKFTAASTGYINLSSSSANYGYAYISKGTCGALSQILSGNCYKNNPLLLYVESGVTYTINSYYLNANSLVIESTDLIRKEITDSYVNFGSDYYYAVVDTVNNTISYTIPTGLDLSNVTYSIGRLNPTYTTLSVNSTIIQASGKINLGTLSSILITGKDGSTCTYTVSITQKSGISCSTATTLTVDKVKGNGESIQFYSLTPTSTGYFELKTDKNYFAQTYKGDCSSLTTISSDNISSYNSLILYGEAGTPYYIKTSGQKSDSLIINKIASLPKEFTSFYVYTPDYNYYYATIDTIKNSISLMVPSDCDLTNLNYNFATTANNYNTVSVGATNILNSGTMDFSALSSLAITGNDGIVVNYNFNIQKVEGLSCTSAKAITGNTVTGNGQNRQYFSYSPTTTKYIRIVPGKSNIYLDLYTGNCNALTHLFSANVYSTNPLDLKVEAGTTYTLQIYYLNSNSITISDQALINKNFKSFQIDDNFSATIDTVKNTITFSVPTDFDLSNAPYSFSMYGYNLTTVTSNGEILDEYGNADFNNLKSLLVTADDGTTETYSISIKKVEGMNCNTAISANYGLTRGNGVYTNFFKFTPDESGFFTMYPSFSSLNLEVFSGTCGNLSSLYSQYAYSNSPSIVKLEGGKTYIVNANYLYNNELVIKKVKSIAKEFNYFQFYNNLNSFNAVIDTFDNTLTFTIPSDIDLSSFQYYFNINYEGSSVVSVDSKAISSSGSMDFTAVKNLTITAIDGSSAVYSLNFIKDNSLNCSTSTAIAEGTITGNGKIIQYFTYTPTVSGYITLSSDNEINASVLKGDCGAFTKVGQSWLEPGSNLALPVEAGIKYTILTKNQLADKFDFAFVKNVGIDFSFFRLRDHYYNLYNSDIDTVLNKITFKIPAGLDKAYLLPDFEFLGNQDLTVSANNVTIENEYMDFSNISTLTLTNKDNVSVTYSVIFAETPGADCITATALTQGTTTGNGLAKQYFTFAPTQSGYIKVATPDQNSFYFSISEGTCSNLDFGNYLYIGPANPKVFKVEKGQNYVMAIENLKANKLNLSYVNSVEKELVYASLFDGWARYYGAIDTLANTISFTVSSGLDLSLVNYSLELKDLNNTHIVAGNDSIGNYGLTNFSNLNTLTIKANDGTTVTYSVSFKTTDVPVYIIRASCLENGSISPNGNMSVEKGSNLVFTISPKNGYGVKELYVDNELVTSAKSYTFSNITGPHSIHATFEQTTAVKSASGVQVKLYPNPFKNNFTVEAESGTEVKVFNTQGSRIFESLMNGNSQTINLSTYPQGLYLIEVRKGEKTERFKAIKQ